MVNLIVGEKTINDIELVIFDKDGTLFDLHKYWSFIIRERAKYFSGFFTGCDANSVYSILVETMGLGENNQVNKTGPVGIKSRNVIIDLVYKALKPKKSNFSIQDIKDGFEIIDSIADSRFGEIVQKLPGVDELILTLKEHRCLIAAATVDTKQRTIKSFEHEKILDYFDYIVGSDKVLRSKPDSEMVDVILDKFSHVNRNRVVLIGDSVVDLEMAKNAKINFIGVMTGVNSDDFVQNSGFLVKNLMSIGIKI